MWEEDRQLLRSAKDWEILRENLTGTKERIWNKDECEQAQESTTLDEQPMGKVSPQSKE